MTNLNDTGIQLVITRNTTMSELAIHLNSNQLRVVCAWLEYTTTVYITLTNLHLYTNDLHGRTHNISLRNI